MSQTPAPPRRVSIDLLALVALWALMHIPALFSHQPWHFDELRYLEVARQLGEYGNWLVPHINGEVYQEKPPLFFWCVVIVQRLTGAGYVVAGHLTVALALLGTALMVCHLGRVLFADRRIGALGGAVFLTFFFVHDLGTRALLDPFFIALTTAGVVALLHAGISEGFRRRLGWAGVAALATTAACMTKGPVGIAVIVISALALGLAWRGRRGVSFTALLLAAAVAGGLTLLWVYLAAQQAGWWYWERMVFRQTVDRAVESWAHAKPWWMYFANLPRMLLPWIVVLPAAAWGAWRARRGYGGRAGLGVAAWLIGVLLFFTLLSGKRMGYLAPIFPALGLFIAWGMSRTFMLPDGKTRLALVRAPQWLLGVLPFAGALAALALAVGPWLPVEHAADLPAATTPVALVGAVILVAAGLHLRRQREPVARALFSALATLGIGALLAHVAVYPALDRQLTPEPIAAYILQHKAPGERLVMLNDHKDGRVNFYLNARRHEVHRAHELPALAAQPGRLWVVAFSKQWRKDVPPEVKTGFALEFEYAWAGTTTQIYAERAAP